MRDSDSWSNKPGKRVEDNFKGVKRECKRKVRNETSLKKMEKVSLQFGKDYNIKILADSKVVLCVA